MTVKEVLPKEAFMRPQFYKERHFMYFLCIIQNVRVMKTNLMHCLSSVCLVNQPLNVSGMFLAHHQEVYCIYTTTGMCFAFQLTSCWPAGRHVIFTCTK